MVALTMAACGGDDSGSGRHDAAVTQGDAPRDTGGGSDTGGGGLTGSDVFASPTDISVGQTGSGSLAVFVPASFGPSHYWRFTPPTAANYQINLTGAAGMTATWCGANATQQGCLCDVTGAAPYACCTTTTAACVAITKMATASAAGIIFVENDGNATATYTISMAAP